MTEILAGKLATSSTLNKGTLVHIEVPLHLLNQDHESKKSSRGMRIMGSCTVTAHMSGTECTLPVLSVGTSARAVVSWQAKPPSHLPRPVRVASGCPTRRATVRQRR
jgi:hypothetical protein